MSRKKLYLDTHKKIKIIIDNMNKNNYQFTFEKIIEKHLEYFNKKYVKYELKKYNHN